ncbi:MAG TPA: hypothetical protein VJ772_10275 [Nitrososphaeraceae archaeon]|nr:hypothetical protein [Nitrososphaeraceae archaeon]
MQTGNETWPYMQIKPIDKDGLHDLICQAVVHYDYNDFYKQVYRSLDKLNITMQTDGLVYGCTNLIFNN